MMYQALLMQSVELGWDFYGPLLIFVGLIVPWNSHLGINWCVATTALLIWSGALPLSLLGESLFDGIDHFALTAVPLFILTGDVLVRTGLSKKFLDVAEALTCWTRGGFGSATVLVCGMFSAISGSDAAGAAAVGRNDHCTLGRVWLSKALRLCIGGQWSLYWDFDPSIHRLYCDWPGLGDLCQYIVSGSINSRCLNSAVDLDYQYGG